MKTLSIIGIVLFSLALLFTFSVWFDDALISGLETLEQLAKEINDSQLSENVDLVWGAYGLMIFAGLFGSIFGLVLSIVGVTVSVKQQKKGEKPLTWRLQELDALKKSGALTENEFEAKKRELLNY